MKTLIKETPGHARAYTLWLALILAVTSFLVTGQLATAIESIFLVFGIFLADQATHLAQEDHSKSPSTALERFMQKYRLTSIILGTSIAIISLVLISL